MRRSIVLPALLLVLSACGDGDNIHRALKLDGEACLEDSECANARCLDAVCRSRCETDADCKSESLVCSRGGCLPRPLSECGNNVQEEGEACDDGNRKDDDGCSADCQLDPPECGNGVTETGEECDDHNNAPDDGCSPTCENEPPPPAQWVTGNWSACSTTCGKGTQTRSVECHSGADVVSDDQCPQPAPDESEACSDNSGCTCSASTEIFTAAMSQAVTVPAGCPQLIVETWGGGGAGGSQKAATGGGGGYATATFTVTPGETLEVQIGEGGQAPGDGGGASSVRRNTVVLLIAGGGGGGASDGCSGCSSGGAGGAGGGEQGQSGLPFTYNPSLAYYCASATPGLGGTPSQGGQGGTSAGNASSPKCSGGNGSAETGGLSNGGYSAGACNDRNDAAIGWQAGGGEGNGHGGAGGAGWYGGGGGGFIWTYCGGGGGGGSSHVHESATEVQLESGNYQQAAHISGSAGAGAGGNIDIVSGNADNAGANGRVVLHWGG